MTKFLNNIVVSGTSEVVYQTDGRTGGVIYSGSTTPSSPLDGDIWIDNSLSTDPAGNTSISGSLSVTNFITIPVATSVSSNVPAGGGALVLNSRSYLFDDGNLHINTNNGTIWINSNDASSVQINTQGSASTGGLIVGGNISSSNIADSGWITVSSFSNSFTATNTVAYRKLNGVVYLRGSVNGGTANTTAFTLPTGYRPAAGGTYSTQNYGTSNMTYITVNTDGTVVPNLSATWFTGVAIPIG